MKKNKKILLPILLAVFYMQLYIFCRWSHVFYENGFAIGLLNTEKGAGAGNLLMYLLIPLLFILFSTSGSVYEITHGYGKLLIIRNYSKTKLMLRKILKTIITVLLIVCVQCLVFWPFNGQLSPVSDGMAESLLMYFVILLALIMLQHLLEFYFSTQIVNLSLFIYCFISVYAVQTSVQEGVWFKMLFWPSLLFGMQNGAVDGEPVYGIFLAAGICLNLLLMVLCIRKFKKTDIF